MAAEARDKDKMDLLTRIFLPLAALYVHRREVFNPFYQVAGYNRNGDWGWIEISYLEI